MWQCLSFPRSLDLTQWMSTNAQLNALVSRRRPCNAGWINLKVRQNKPVLQCFNLLGAPVHVTKLSASPVGFLRMYLKPPTPEHPRTERTFNILQFRVRVSICLFYFTYCQVIWVFQGSGSGFPVVHMTIFSSEPNNAQKCFSPLRLTPTGYAVDSHFSKE